MMESFLPYLLKSSGILFLFWLGYRLLLRQETFFGINRWFLVLGILSALVFPYLQFKHYVMVDTTSLESIVIQNTDPSEFALPKTEVSLYWPTLLLGIYLIGCTVFLLRFLMQLFAVQRLRWDADTWLEKPYLHVKTKRPIAPFSFFRSLFYHPGQFSSRELDVVLRHEKEHARQWHTLDVLLLEALCILLWWNPLAWRYKDIVKQNLEYLADQKAVSYSADKKQYQFLLLRQATGLRQNMGNSFYNSLIKKRIVMLNQKQSKKTNALKSLAILPVLGFFLWSFNTEKVYQYPEASGETVSATDKTVELTINKDTSNEELEKMKTDLGKDAIDFSYTVVRNTDGEIIDISLQVSGENSKGESFSGNYQSNSEDPISPILVFYDDDANVISFGGTHQKHLGIHKNDVDTVVWEGLGEIGEHEDIVVVRKIDGKKIVINGKGVNGEEQENTTYDIIVHEDADSDKIKLEILSDDHDTNKSVKVKKYTSTKGRNVMILKDPDDETDIEILNDEGFFFIDNDGEGDPLYIIDGEEAKAKDVKKLSRGKIKSINVSKGKGTKKKYGRKAKHGVVEITTKKKG